MMAHVDDHAVAVVQIVVGMDIFIVIRCFWVFIHIGLGSLQNAILYFIINYILLFFISRRFYTCIIVGRIPLPGIVIHFVLGCLDY